MGKAEKTRQFIIEQVAPIFNQKGYEATSMKDIIQATKLTKGAIYGNFKNGKNQLAQEVLKHNIKVIRELVIKKLRQAKSMEEKILSYCRVYEENITTVLSVGGCPLQNTINDAFITNSALKQIAQTALEEWYKTLVYLIEKGQQTGELKNDINPDYYASVIISLIEGGIFMSKAFKNIKMLEYNINQIQKIVKQDLVI